jgi:MFS family permease
VALACGFTQTLPVATLAEVARHFGHQVQGASLAEQAGLSGSVLGLGLALLRIAAIGGMPIAAFADRRGRRPVMLRTARHRINNSRVVF